MQRAHYTGGKARIQKGSGRGEKGKVIVEKREAAGGSPRQNPNPLLSLVPYRPFAP
jgi:hypothetical protein